MTLALLITLGLTLVFLIGQTFALRETTRALDRTSATIKDTTNMVFEARQWAIYYRMGRQYPGLRPAVDEPGWASGAIL